MYAKFMALALDCSQGNHRGRVLFNHDRRHQVLPDQHCHDMGLRDIDGGLVFCDRIGPPDLRPPPFVDQGSDPLPVPMTPMRSQCPGEKKAALLGARLFYMVFTIFKNSPMAFIRPSA